jgi:predicted transcriptional regulator
MRFGGQMSEHYAFVMMVKEKYWVEYRNRHNDGKRIHSYVGRGAAPPKNARVLLFYVSKPVKALGGRADFVERKLGTPEELWAKYGDESVLRSRESYEEFVGPARIVSFVRFENLREAANSIPLVKLLMLLGHKRLSRKGFYLDKETTARLISLME